MNENRENNRFIGYEYKQVAAEPGQISFLIDGYMNFGWEIDENVQDTVSYTHLTLPTT